MEKTSYEVMKLNKKGYIVPLLLILAVALILAVIGFIYIYASETSGITTAATVGTTGQIRVSGAWALYPLMVKWAEEYQKQNPNIRIDVSAGGAGKGMADALSDLVDLGMVSREISSDEVAKGAYFVPVTKDAVFATISAKNPVAKEIAKTGVTKQDFVDLWMDGKQLKWGDLAGDSDDKINVYTRSDACGAAETWAIYLGGAQEDLKGTAVYGDPGVAEAVKKDKLGIGYNNLNYAYDASTGAAVEGIQVVMIDANGNGKIDANEDIKYKRNAITAVQTGVYPAPPARDLYLVTKDSFKGPTKDFVNWILTEGQNYVDEVGYIGLSDEKLQAALTKVQ